MEIAAGSVGHMISLSLVYFFFFSFFESRSDLVSFQTDHSIWCVLIAFLTKPKPHFKVLHAQYTTLFHVKMLISHDNMKYFLLILLKQ